MRTTRFLSVTAGTHCPLEFSISRVYWQNSVAWLTDFTSPHFSLSELWFAARHSHLGGAGGRGRVENRCTALKGPAPMLLMAYNNQVGELGVIRNSGFFNRSRILLVFHHIPELWHYMWYQVSARWAWTRCWPGLTFCSPRCSRPERPSCCCCTQSCSSWWAPRWKRGVARKAWGRWRWHNEDSIPRADQEQQRGSGTLK